MTLRVNSMSSSLLDAALADKTCDEGEKVGLVVKAEALIAHTAIMVRKVFIVVLG
jgi:hypothetical protein